MLTKRSWIVLLAGANALLGALLVAGSVRLPGARAQMSARAGDFVTVTAKPAGRNYDVIYMLDVPKRKLYAFHPDGRQSRNIVAVPARDLEQDFGR